MTRTTAAIHVYYDDQPDAARAPYTVARVDEDGDEIVSEDSYPDLAAAWVSGCDLAEYLGVPCVEYSTAESVATNQETDRWEPEAISAEDIDCPWEDFVDVGPSIGTDEDYEAECSRLDDCYTEVCRGTKYTIYARPPRSGEICSLYAITGNGDFQILGGSIEVPDVIQELCDRAWERFCSQE